MFGPPESNESLFEALVAPRIASVVSGFNATIFAYGQTASGKTHTMLGSAADPGITLRAVDSVFERIAMDETDERQYLIRASYIEIYNEELTDLLVEVTCMQDVWVRVLRQWAANFTEVLKWRVCLRIALGPSGWVQIQSQRTVNCLPKVRTPPFQASLELSR